MNTYTICPVPREQRPLKEFRQLNDSWFFSWPVNKGRTLYKNLFGSWIMGIPLCIFVGYGSWTLKNDLSKLILISIFSSLLAPFLILVRQWLGWNYIFKRLVSKSIEYEESGWYDGQTWEKPTDWRTKDILIAQYEVKPILSIIEKTLLITITAIIMGICLCQSI